MFDSNSIKEEIIQKQLSQKRIELEQMVQEAFQKHLLENEIEDYSGLAPVLEELIQSFVKITPPEVDISMRMIVISPGGRGGGSSTKPGNLTLSYRKLIAAVGAGGLTIAGVLGPWTGILAALVLWDLLYSGLKIDLSEREAAVLWAMWKNCDLNNEIDQPLVLSTVNQSLKQNGRAVLSEEELTDSLQLLEKLSCIERITSIKNRWWLREWVRVPYR